MTPDKEAAFFIEVVLVVTCVVVAVVGDAWIARRQSRKQVLFPQSTEEKEEQEA